jgi:hypothetical protein
MNERNGAVLERTIDQEEIDALFRDITDLIDLSAPSDLDLQGNRITELGETWEQLHARIMARPKDAFDVYFTIFARLYEGRTFTETDSLGTAVSQFVTRNPERTEADLHFRELQYDSGSVERVVEVTRPESLPYFISLKDDELRIAYTVYERGQYRRKSLDPASPSGEGLLDEFFTHYTDARDQLKTRGASDIDTADTQAKQFLLAKVARDRRL